MSAASVSWAKRNPERVKEHKRRFRERHRERIAAERAADFQANKAKKYAERQKWIDANPDMVAAQAIRRRMRRLHSDMQLTYNVTAEQYQRIHEAQGGLCAICRKPNETTRTKRLFVDHNHTTGRLRALLCHSCNAGLGYFREDPALFLRAIAYIKAFEGEPEHPEWDQDAVLVLGRAGWEDWT